MLIINSSKVNNYGKFSTFLSLKTGLDAIKFQLKLSKIKGRLISKPIIIDLKNL